MFQNIRDDWAVHGRSLTNGGFWALVVYRFGAWSLEWQFKPMRWMTGKMYGILRIFIEITTGVRIYRGTKIGKGFHIIHTGMVLIHPDTVIGERCGIMHSVTLGTNMGTDAPVIGNDVFLGCGCSVLGKVKVGDGALIGANSLVIADVPPGAVALGVPANIMPNLRPLRVKKPPAAENTREESSPAPAASSCRESRMV
jgi:serine O-acetyltransferase